MNKTSFMKIIDLDLININEKDLDLSLKSFLNLKDNNLKQLFLDNYKIIIKKYLIVLLSNVKVYPVYETNNKDIYILDKLLYYYYSLYGIEEVIKLKINKGTTDNSKNILLACIKRYHNRVNHDLMNGKELMMKLDFYHNEKELLTKYSNVDKEILKEAYNTYFSLDNFFLKDEYQKNKEKFVKEKKITYNVLTDYVRLYGFLYLNISLENMERKINSITAVIRSDTNINIIRLEDLILNIYNAKDQEEIKKIVYDNHISVYTIKKFINEYPYHKTVRTDKGETLINKVNLALKKLREEHKYIHYSLALSIIEKTSNHLEIKEIVKNNPTLIEKTRIDYFISVYRINLDVQKKKELKEELILKIENAKKEIKEEKEKIRELKKDQYKNAIIESTDFKMFLNPAIKTITDFCNLYNITRDDFETCLNTLIEKDQDLYSKIKNKIKSLKKQRYTFLVNKINKIATEIIEGIYLEDGSKKDFELLDYFLKTSLDFKDFIDIYINNNQDINKDTLIQIRSFFKKNNVSKEINIKAELDGTTIFMIENNPYKVSRKEKEATINYLKTKNIPLYPKVYSQALKRYVMGNLIKEDTPSKKIIKKLNS